MTETEMSETLSEAILQAKGHLEFAASQIDEPYDDCLTAVKNAARVLDDVIARVS